MSRGPGEGGVPEPGSCGPGGGDGTLPFLMKDLPSQVGDLDLLFSTVPAPVVTGKVLNRMSYACVIIDLASKPGEPILPLRKNGGSKRCWLPACRELSTSKTAGRILARTITRLMEEELGEEG